MYLYDLAIKLQEKITEHVTDVSPLTDEDYKFYRGSLVKQADIKGLIPDFIITNRTVLQLNSFIRSDLSHYQERRDYIHHQFISLLDYLEFESNEESDVKSSNLVFISYSVKDKAIAGKLKSSLSKHKIPAFLAHEDIDVSEEWQVKILNEIKACPIFICLLSKNFIESDFCIQETGIAAVRESINIIPLSIDGQIPIGFIQKYQSTKINSETISVWDILPSLLKNSPNIGINLALDILAKVWGFRLAEDLCEQLTPYLGLLDSAQIIKLIVACKTNDQVYDASLCASNFLPKLITKFNSVIDQETNDFFVSKIDRYSK